MQTLSVPHPATQCHRDCWNSCPCSSLFPRKGLHREDLPEGLSALFPGLGVEHRGVANLCLGVFTQGAVCHPSGWLLFGGLEAPGPWGYPGWPLSLSLAFPRHNDLPWQLLTRFNNKLQVEAANLTSLTHTHTNIPKLKAGFVGGQVWLSPALHLPVLGSLHPSSVSGLWRRPSLVAVDLLSPLKTQVFGRDLESHTGHGRASKMGGEPDAHMPVRVGPRASLLAPLPCGP